MKTYWGRRKVKEVGGAVGLPLLRSEIKEGKKEKEKVRLK